MTDFDLIIIGAGPGGYEMAAEATRHQLKVAVIERDELGGTCLNRGCIPTKTLCRNAEIVDTLRHADTFGLMGEGYSLDFGRVMERKQEVIGQLRSGVETLMQTPGITLVRGTASFTDAHTIAVGDDQYTADNIIIATGSDSKCPPIEGTTLPGVVTSTELLDVDHLPKRLCIIGAGVIGMEFASVFSSFGSNVTVIEFLKECLPVLDSDIAKRLRQTICKRGVEFYMQSAVKSITQTDTEDRTKQLTVSFEKKGKPVSIDADMVLIATGRKPCTEGLALEQVGIEHSPKGIVVDDDFQTNVSGVYAIGDVNGRCLLAHAATFQGLHVVNRILNRPDDIRFDVMPSAIFTNPEAASVGLSEDQLKAEQRPYECRKGFYRSNGKALAMNETDGMIKLLVDTTNDQRIVGCHAFGAHSADMVQEIAALMNSGTTLQQLANIIHIHPTLSEILHDMAL